MQQPISINGQIILPGEDKMVILKTRLSRGFHPIGTFLIISRNLLALIIIIREHKTMQLSVNE